MRETEKNIAFFIENQFPGIYREAGPELVKIVEEYYRFMEEDIKQSHYIGRRIFEYRDISTTLNSMLIYFKNKFLKDLPFDETTVKFIVRHIQDLYHRKGTKDGIILFFRLFYNESIEIYYPASQMLKPSNAKWQTGVFLEMEENNNSFDDIDGNTFTYADLIGRNITGSISGAKAAVNSINSVLINKTLTPIIYLDAVQGVFTKYDELLTRIGENIVRFGVVKGSLSDFTVDVTSGGTTGNKKGNIFDVVSAGGQSGRAIVTEITNNPTGQVTYDVEDGGFGYSIENTRLVVSNQSIVLENSERVFIEGERLRDTDNNFGTVIGQNDGSVGVLMDPGDEFEINRNISTVDRNPNLNIVNLGSQASPIVVITPINESSPGPMFVDTGLNTDVKVSDLINQETVSLITDPIANFIEPDVDHPEGLATGPVYINSPNYNAVPPAAAAMSGTEPSANLATSLDAAFDLTPFDIGSIVGFRNINPGSDYRNDVFAYAVDDTMKLFDRYNQILTVDPPETATDFNIGEIIAEVGTGINAKVLATDGNKGTVTILPYSYYGYSGANVIGAVPGQVNVIDISVDYNSKNLGDNATIDPSTDFASGRIRAVKIYNSGFGYVNNAEAYLADEDGVPQIRGTINVSSQGVTAGYWGDFSSHLNGYLSTSFGEATDEYFDGNMRIQDSDYFQEYSYEVKSTLPLSQYEKLLKENVHLAGTKLFGQFYYRYKNTSALQQGFIRIFNDDGRGSALDVADPANISTDITNLYSDSTVITSDNDKDALNGGAVYTVTPIGGTSINEGGSLTFSVTLTNHPGGVIYWTVSRPEDFTFDSGNVVVSNNTGTFQIQADADFTTEGEETFYITLHTGSGAGPVIHTAGPFTINDTSTA